MFKQEIWIRFMTVTVTLVHLSMTSFQECTRCLPLPAKCTARCPKRQQRTPLPSGFQLGSIGWALVGDWKSGGGFVLLGIFLQCPIGLTLCPD